MPPLLSPYLQKKRFEAVKPYLHGKVLDLGCGGAEILSWLNPRQSYVGVEGNLETVFRLKKMYPALEFLLRDLEHDELGFSQKFDTILLIAVIEHLHDPDHLLSQIPGLLMPTGNLVITTPTPMGDRFHKIGAKLGLFSMIAVYDHEVIYTFKTLKNTLSRVGLDIRKYQQFLFGGNQLCICGIGST
jgi:2-polyprenyl-3-methyl-5-hydroxy-6-metoxy-1,4-benzoquinol methylase